jgi:hypothetical protein
MTLCRHCHAPAVIGATTIHCLRCLWERPVSATARRRLVADVTGRTRRPARKGGR